MLDDVQVADLNSQSASTDDHLRSCSMFCSCGGRQARLGTVDLAGVDASRRQARSTHCSGDLQQISRLGDTGGPTSWAGRPGRSRMHLVPSY